MLVALCIVPAAHAAGQVSRNVAHQKYLGLASDPATATAGSAFYRSDLDVFRVHAADIDLWQGGAWVRLPSRLRNCSSTVTLEANPFAFYLNCSAEMRTVFTAVETQTFQTNAGLYLRVDADDGGAYDATSKDVYVPLRLSLAGRTRGEHHLIRGQIFGFGIGDAVWLGGAVWGYGARNVSGTSQPTAEFAEINVKQGATVFTATISGDPAAGATTISYTGDSNEYVVGERALINTSRTTTTGTVSSITTTDVTFSGAPDWTAANPSPVGQYFKINSEDVTLGGTSTGHWYRVASVVSATVLRLETSYDTARLATSGAYTLAQGAEITAFNTLTNQLTIEANSYDWGAGDALISPPMPLVNFRGLNLILTKELKTGTSRAIDLNNTGPFPWNQGVLIEGAPAAANAFEDGIAVTAKVDDAIDLASATIATSALRIPNEKKIRWGTDASPSDFYFTTSGATFFMTKALRVEGSSASVTPLIVKQTQASPSVQFFRVIDSANANVFEVDSAGIVNLKTAFGGGIRFTANGTPTITTVGTNSNLDLLLDTKGTGALKINSTASSGTGGFAIWDGAASPASVFTVSAAGNTVISGTLSVTGETTFGAGGVAANGAGFKHGRVTTGSIAAGSSAAVTLTWTTAFGDANYTANCSVVEATASTSTLRLHHIESVATTGVTVRIVNDDGSNAHTGALHCTAVHD